jgi:hypothetical protein
MRTKNVIAGMLAAGFVAATVIMLPSAGYAQDAAAKVKTAMELLKSKAGKLGPAKVDGNEPVNDKQAPAIFFGGTKMNNNYTLVDEVTNEVGGTATIFVKSGDEFVRVATNVKKDDGTRATGTILDPNGKAIDAIKKNEAYYGEATILGKPYITGYEPIRGAGNTVLGIYYVGYVKD